MRRALLLLAGLAAAASAQPSPERQRLTAEDYRATLERLSIGTMRPGADGWNRNAPNAANYDEAKAKLAGPLPDLLRGARNAAGWRRERPEIAELFSREMYGRVPATAPRILWALQSTEHRSKGPVAVSTRHYVGRASAPGSPPVAIRLDLTVPREARGPVPLILELGFAEGFRFPGAPRRPPGARDWTDEVLARGWAYGILVASTVQPDDGAGLSEGVIGLASQGRPRAPDEWGALRAWAWGASRALDLFEADPRIDKRRIAVEGLSRYGKAALVAMAFEPRFSIGFIGSSGAGGAKLLRRDFGERLENLVSSGEYHWFAPNFLKYGGPLRTEDLPVDAHMLIALVAPRPLFIGAGNFDEDGWVDPRGSWEAARAATPAYLLLGVPGLVGGSYPAPEEAQDRGRIAFRQHRGGHTNGPNWPAFLDFAARHWGLAR